MAVQLVYIDIGIHHGLKENKVNPQRTVFKLTLESLYSIGCKSPFYSTLTH